MINKSIQILSLYFKNQIFILVSGIFLLSATVSKILYSAGQGWLAEDVTTILFVTTLWLTFHLGVILKRQFANPRASLLPGYRKPHAYCAAFIYTLFILVLMLWDHGLVPLVEVTPHGLQGLYILCALVAILITAMGYLSIGRAFIYGYAGMLILSIQSLAIISTFNTSPYLKYVIAALGLTILIAFRNRLLKLKEENFEYGYLLSWPPNDHIINRFEINPFASGQFRSIKKFFHIEERLSSMTAYPRGKNILIRSQHWNQTESLDIKWACLLLLVVSPVYVLLMKSQPAIEVFFRSAYSNFLLLAITPVLMTFGSQYRKMGYWGYDLLKPVKKEQYVKEQGIILLTHLLFYWLVFNLCFALLPSLILQPEVFNEKTYWGFIILTGTFSFMVLAWLVLLSGSSQSWTIVIHGILLSHIMMFLFYFASRLNFEAIMGLNALCVAVGIIMLNKARFAWCQKEFQ